MVLPEFFHTLAFHIICKHALMEIRRINTFSEEIYSSVLRLLPQLAPDSELPSREYMNELLSSENIHFFIAASGDEIAGMLTLVLYLIPTGKKLWIEDVVVDSSHRGEGLGEKLVEAALDFARSLGATEVRLTSRPARIAANKLYQKIGFEKYETNVYKIKL